MSDITSNLTEWIQKNNRLNRGKPEAAVLVPFIEKNGIPHLVLTKRSNNLRTHSGQISFPGGKVDSLDKNIMETALRETEEEIGIKKEEIHMLGLLDDFFTPYFNSVTPILAKLDSHNYTISEDEIDKIIEVPVKDLINPQIYHSEIWTRDGIDYEIHFYNWHDPFENEIHEIWGATATVIYKILKIINLQQYEQ
ncbi:MAG: NUDIX hydrolase [Candidatus Kariarchaeaceae archaeon]